MRRGLAYLGGLALASGQAPFGAWPLALAGLVLGVLLWLRAATAREAAFQGWTFGVGAFSLSLIWLVNPFLVEPWRHGWMIPFALFLMSGGLALFWALAFGLAKRVTGRVPMLVALWGLAELARGWVFTGFPWGLPAYIWLDTPVSFAAAFVGPYGLTTLTFGLAALLAVAVWRRRATALAPAAVLATLLAISAVVLPQPPNATGPVVRVVQPNAPQHLKWHPDHIQTFFSRALTLTPSTRAELVIWPETSVPAPLYAAGPYLADVADAAGPAAAVVGLNRVDGMRGYNTALMLAEGQIAASYDKRHLVPFGEYMPMPWLLERIGLRAFTATNGYGYSAGETLPLFDTPAGRALPLICYEAIFPRDLRSAERPDFLMQLTNDAWFGTFSGPQQALAQARFRAIETGLPLVRAANTGVSAIIDARGRVLTHVPLNQAGAIEAAMPRAAPPTVYAQWGETGAVFLLICFALLSRVPAQPRRGKGD